jgi:hypothetical protein
MSVNEILQQVYQLPLEERQELSKILNENIEDPMLSIDPYYYERKEHIANTINNIESGKIKVYDSEEFEDEMDEFEKELVLKYGH